MLRVGDRLPDLALLDPDERRESLRRIVNEHTLLIFLRHLA
jgi:hypothetical protein